MRYAQIVALIVAGWIALAAVAAPAPGVESFAPLGSVKSVRQVTVRFATPMVRLGDPRLDAPFTVDCARPGHGRWIDARHWVYDFDADLPGALRCRLRLHDALVDLDGRTLAGARVFEFDTGGPAIRESMPRDGDTEIDEAQVFLLALDAAPTPESVAAHARCRIQGRDELVTVEVLDGAERSAVLESRRMLGYGYYQLLWPGGRASDKAVEAAELADAEARIWALRCRQAVPPATGVELIWGAGIAAANGVASTSPQRLVFRTRPAFTASLTCERTNARAPCLPFGPLTLSFSTPVPIDLALGARLRAADGALSAPKAEGKSATVESVAWAGPFPERAQFTLELPPTLTDDAGRPLENRARFPLTVGTDAFPPIAKFGADFGILELATGGVLPLTLRNVEPGLGARQATVPGAIAGATLRVGEDDAAIAHWLRAVKDAMAPRGEWIDRPDGSYYWEERTGEKSVYGADARTEKITIPRRLQASEFEVVGIPLAKPGFYVIELASPKLGAALLGADKTRYVATTALVTNLSVHLKWGRESSRVWVTTLDGATAVPNAAITVTGYCDGALLWQGRTDAEGLARIDGVLPPPHLWEDCGDWHPQPLMVSARVDGDMSFTVSGWQRGIAPHQFGFATGSEQQAQVMHTVLDRALFRAGETVSMKHYARTRTGAGFAVPAPRTATLTVQHRGSDQKYEFAVGFDAAGIAESEWPIPKDARLGEYDLRVMVGDRQQHAGALRVEQYRVPLMTATVQAPAAPLIGARDLALDLYVGYLAGGGAAGLDVKLRSFIEPVNPAVPGYDDYSFTAEPIVAGTVTEPGGWDPFGGARPNAPATTPARMLPVTLDGEGAARVSVPELPVVSAPHQVVAELEYSDPNGEILAHTQRVPLWPAALRVGVRTEGWAATRDLVRFRAVVVDLEGKPRAGQDVAVDVYVKKMHSYRKRLIGGFYAYESSTETRRLEAGCNGRTDARGLLLCEIEPAVSGELILRAVVRDGQGNEATATRSVWVVGEDEWWFAASAGDRMDLLPEQKTYEPGAVARLQVRMPFRRATALVTIEREGVLEAYTVALSGRESIIEVPIKSQYAPNVYISVLAVRGRIGRWWTWLADLNRRFDLPFDLEGGTATALLDLSKPAFRLGAAKIDVGWQPHRLEVEVHADAERYPIRGRARINIAARRADGGTLPPGAEVAIAAVDAGLLELMPNGSWNLLEAMMGTRGIEVYTATAQMQVVGKRHYGRKAVLHGGGGGHTPGRELFDTLLAWHGRVPLDANGKATIEIPLNDSLTAFRIVAVASAGPDRFGTGATTIRTQQDLVLYAGMAPVVRESDVLAAVVTARNAGSAPTQVTVRAAVGVDDGVPADLPTQSIELAPGAARALTFAYTVPVGATRLHWEIAATGGSGTVLDRLRVAQDVHAAWPVRVQQSMLTQVDPQFAVEVARPADAFMDRGGVEVALHASLAGTLEGVREYMARYPYTCMEQRVSRAIVLGTEADWRLAMAMLPSHFDADGLVKYFASDWLRGSDVLTAYVLAIAAEAGLEIPAAPAARMRQGLRAFVEGRITRASELPAADLAIRKLAALEALSRYGDARAEDLGSIAIEPNLWPTSAVLDWLQLLTRLESVPDRAARLAEAERILRARIDLSGTVMRFSNEADDRLWWLMVSPESNAARAISALLERADWREDLPRLVRGALERQRRGHWSTTTANAWGVAALARFRAAFEAQAVTGTTEFGLAAARATLAWDAAGSPAARLAWPESGNGRVELVHTGSGRPWAVIQTLAALPLREPLNAGFSVARRWRAVEQQVPGQWTVGDVVRVTLDVDAQADVTWAVVDDPIPAGAAILGTGLGRDSAALARTDADPGAAWLAYSERRFEAYRAYYAYVPKGRFQVQYTLRLNSAGRYQLPPTHVEAMYAPEMFADLPNAAVEVQPRP